MTGVEEQTELPVTQAAPAPQAAPKAPPPKKPRAPRAPAAAPEPEPKAQTVEQRLAATKAKARQLAHEQGVRIPLRLGVSLEMHESLVAIAEKVGPAKIPDVAIRCMEIGAEQWGRTLKLNAAAPIPHTVSSAEWGAKYPPTSNDDEARARAAIQAAVQANEEVESSIQAERDEAAAKLHLPGRKRAAG
jgi:hypothetical protein